MKALFLILTMALAFNANAIVINETTAPRLDSTFIDVGVSHYDTREGGLEWLDFGTTVGDAMTFNQSLNSASTNYGVGNGGWRLATEFEVTDLFTLFFPTYSSTTGIMTVQEGDGTSDLIQSRNSWLFAFGTDAVATLSDTINTEAPLLSSRGLYFNEGTQSVQMAGITLETNPLLTTLYGMDNTQLGWNLDQHNSAVGVFMVRDYVPAVPVPAAIWLFASGLLGLVTISRRKA